MWGSSGCSARAGVVVKEGRRESTGELFSTPRARAVAVACDRLVWVVAAVVGGQAWWGW